MFWRDLDNMYEVIMFNMFNDGHLETTHSEIKNNGIQSQAAMKTKLLT